MDGARRSIPVSRNRALDWVKGWLVVSMLAYHVASLFSSSETVRIFLQSRLLDFVSGSWVFIAGILIGSYYLRRAEVQFSKTAKRLITRGIKLLLLVTVINVILGKLQIDWNQPVSGAGEFFWNRLVKGNLSNLSFEILIGIGCFLVMAPLFLWKKTLGWVIAAVVIGGGIMWTQAGNHLNGNLRMEICGTAGISIGMLLVVLGEGTWLPRLVARRGLLYLLTVGAYLLYWWLLAGLGMDRGYIGPYLLGIISVLGIFYLSYDALNWPPLMRSSMNLMARYSLVCYMGQMALIWSWYYLVGDLSVLGSYSVSMGVLLVLMLVGIRTLDYLVQNHERAKRAYAAVFL